MDELEITVDLNDIKPGDAHRECLELFARISDALARHSDPITLTFSRRQWRLLHAGAAMHASVAGNAANGGGTAVFTEPTEPS